MNNPALSYDEFCKEILNMVKKIYPNKRIDDVLLFKCIKANLKSLYEKKIDFQDFLKAIDDIKRDSIPQRPVQKPKREEKELDLFKMMEPKSHSVLEKRSNEFEPDQVPSFKVVLTNSKNTLVIEKKPDSESSKQIKPREIKKKEELLILNDLNSPCIYIALLKNDIFFIGRSKAGLSSISKTLSLDNQSQPFICKKHPFVKVIYHELSKQNNLDRFEEIVKAMVKILGFERVYQTQIKKSLVKESKLKDYSNPEVEIIIEDMLIQNNLEVLSKDKERKLKGTRCHYCSGSDHMIANCNYKLSDMGLIEECCQAFSEISYEKDQNLSQYQSLWTIKGDIYVLKLENDNFYVGHTERKADDRFLEHISTHQSSHWSSIFDVRDMVFKMSGDLIDEDKLTLIMMRKFGWWRVRGGRWCDFLSEVPEPLTNPFSMEHINYDDKFLSHLNSTITENLEEDCQCETQFLHKKFACPLKSPLHFIYAWAKKSCNFCKSNEHIYPYCSSKEINLIMLNDFKNRIYSESSQKGYVLRELAFRSPVFLGLFPLDIHSWINHLKKFYHHKRVNQNTNLKFSEVEFELRLIGTLDLKSENNEMSYDSLK